MSKEFIAVIIYDSLLTLILYLFYRFPPKEINALYGYRTKQSSKSQRHWDFAQRFFSKYWLIIPIQIVITHLTFFILGVPFDMDPPIYSTIFFVELVVGTSVLIYSTERQLKKIDDADER